MRPAALPRIWERSRDLPGAGALLHCAGTGTRYYGDDLDILRRYVKDKSVDLV